MAQTERLLDRNLDLLEENAKLCVEVAGIESVVNRGDVFRSIRFITGLVFHANTRFKRDTAQVEYRSSGVSPLSRR